MKANDIHFNISNGTITTVKPITINVCSNLPATAYFYFDDSWVTEHAIAYFFHDSLGGFTVALKHNCCTIPKPLTKEPGTIYVSISSGLNRTHNHAPIIVKKCTCKVPRSGVVIRSLDGSICYLREQNGIVEYFSKGHWHVFNESFPDAPKDGNLYGRKDGQWTKIDPVQSQSDWEEEDSDHHAHVKNRPMINHVVLSGNRILPEVPMSPDEIEHLFS